MACSSFWEVVLFAYRAGADHCVFPGILREHLVLRVAILQQKSLCLGYVVMVCGLIV